MNVPAASRSQTQDDVCEPRSALHQSRPKRGSHSSRDSQVQRHHPALHAGVNDPIMCRSCQGKPETRRTRELKFVRLFVRLLKHRLVFRVVIDRLEERVVERGGARRSSLKGRERPIVNQTNIGTVLKATLGKLLRDGAKRIWAFPSA